MGKQALSIRKKGYFLNPGFMFDNRTDAAGQLLSHLQRYRTLDTLVLAIPRGGVPIGHHIAQSLHVPLDIVLTKKIGHPRQRELAIGAVSMSSRVITNQYDVPDSYIEEETERIRQELQRKYALYRGQRKATDLKGKHLILTDDGIATGNTMYVTIQLVKQQHPEAVTVAVPVSAQRAKQRLESEVDEYISLLSPSNFRTVSQYYAAYEQVSDEEVVALLR